jgi:hypothetical protein
LNPEGAEEESTDDELGGECIFKKLAFHTY